jgi:hypothetical protein
VRRLIAISGEDALTDQEIATFLLSPTGMRAQSFAQAIGICIMALEQWALWCSLSPRRKVGESRPRRNSAQLRELGSTALL